MERERQQEKSIHVYVSTPYIHVYIIYIPKNLRTVRVVLASRGPRDALDDLIRCLNTRGLDEICIYSF